MNQYAFGIDLGGTTVKIGFFSSEGILLDKWEIPTRKENNGEQILPDIGRAVLSYLEEHGLSAGDLLGVGIDVPGAVLEEGIVNRCANLGWGVVHVADELSGMLGGIPIRVANDANAAALGEISRLREYSSIVMVTLGTGVGGGVIQNRQIVTGAFGAAGEIGHIPVCPEETEVCGCGKKGCLEQYASATGIVRLARKKLQETDRDSLLRQNGELSARKVLDAAKAGDELALELLEEVGEYLGRALASISCVLDPQAFVIGGGVSRAGEILINVIRKYYRKYAFHASRDTAFLLATLGNDAGMYGAVHMLF